MLLDLPAEVRNAIYQHVLADIHTLYITREAQFVPEADASAEGTHGTSTAIPSIFLVNRQIKDEALSVALTSRGKGLWIDTRTTTSFFEVLHSALTRMGPKVRVGLTRLQLSPYWDPSMSSVIKADAVATLLSECQALHSFTMEILCKPGCFCLCGDHFIQECNLVHYEIVLPWLPILRAMRKLPLRGHHEIFNCHHDHLFEDSDEENEGRIFKKYELQREKLQSWFGRYVAEVPSVEEILESYIWTLWMGMGMIE